MSAKAMIFSASFSAPSPLLCSKNMPHFGSLSLVDPSLKSAKRFVHNHWLSTIIPLCSLTTTKHVKNCDNSCGLVLTRYANDGLTLCPQSNAHGPPKRT